MATERIRVLHVITRLVLGGAQENTLLTVARLDRSRYDVTLASGPTEGVEGSLEDHIPHDIPFVRIPALVRNPEPLHDWKALRHLIMVMRQGRYHIVHTHTTKAGILGRIAARRTGVPIVIHTPHGHAFHDYLNRFGSEALKALERGLGRWTDRVVCLTEAERQDHLRMGIGRPECFEVIHSGVDVAYYRQIQINPERKRRDLGLPPHGPLVGCVARLVSVKGVEHLLEAVPVIRAAEPRATVVFVGDGPLRPALERRAATLGLNGGVAFLGLRRDIAEILPLFDLVVLPSLNEGMGRVVVQAQAAGRPVIGSRVSGIQEVIDDGRTGLLVPPANSQALAEAVIRCLRDPVYAGSLADEAQATVEAYGIEPMIRRLDDLYQRLIQKKLPMAAARSTGGSGSSY